jgi:hypothetical protein
VAGPDRGLVAIYLNFLSICSATYLWPVSVQWLPS